jgi:hypothetical protein
MAVLLIHMSQGARYLDQATNFTEENSCELIEIRYGTVMLAT